METISLAKAYTESRQHHGASKLLEEIVAAKPHVDHTRYPSPDELRQAGLQRVRDAVALLAQKATPDEVEEYRRFVLNLADKVANAHREGGDSAVSDAERAAIEEIRTALGAAEGQ